MFDIFKRKQILGTGAVRDPLDIRDYRYEKVAAAGEPVDWEKGFDVEKKLNITIPIKNQDGSGSCVGQGWAYYGSVLNAAEVGFYEEQSAKAIYSQIELGLQGGGAYVRDGAKLFVNWGSIQESKVPSYENGEPPQELFMKEKIWKTPEITELADIFKAKEYRTFSAAQNMELFAQAIKDNHGVVGGVEGSNNGTWKSNEPKPPVNKGEWGHCLYWGKFGIDSKGKFIATPNSWGLREKDSLHPDGWQKLREDWFESTFMFNPWTLTDKPNQAQVSMEALKITKDFEKKFIIEGEGAGRKGVVINGLLCSIGEGREANASIYVQNNNGNGVTISTNLYNQLPRGTDF